MSKAIRRAILGSGAFLLTACATQYAPYQYPRGGYSEIQVSPEIYRVRVVEGLWDYIEPHISFGSRDHDLALLRSAELALEKGAKYFVIDGGECRDPYSQGRSVVCKIKIFSERPTVANPSVLVHRAVQVQQEIRTRLGLEPVP